MKSIGFPVITLFLTLVIFTKIVYVKSSTIRTKKFEKLDTNLRHEDIQQSARQFSDYSVVKPIIYHGRSRRAANQKDSSTHLTVQLPLNNKELTLDLILNKELISKDYFRKIQKNGTYWVQTFDAKDITLCHYTGKVRNHPDSWVAVSTCDGLSGVIHDGDQTHYIEKNRKTKNKHFLYSTLNLVKSEEEETNPIFKNKADFIRYKRSIRGPWNANFDSRYVELVLVVDNAIYKDMGENVKRVEDYCKNIANIINKLYFPLNIFVALVGVVVWTERDEIEITTDPDKTLHTFLNYRRTKLLEHPNDNAQLIIKSLFANGLVGRALKGPICTYEFSGGVTGLYSSTVGLTATSVAHMLGHNLGMEHDTSECECPNKECIMIGKTITIAPIHWSSCSRNAVQQAYEHGMDHCLRNKPESLFQSPVCGNGFVEDGEECDCGLPEHCKSNCCNPNTCMLHSNATCATGECCNLYTCRLENPGTICRQATNECDLPEYCTGDGELCPPDVYKMDTEICGSGDSYCYHGQCNSHLDQCKVLWGAFGENGADECYKLNSKGSRYGNCGYYKPNASYEKCNEEDMFCGMLHCSLDGTDVHPKYGLESVTILSHTYIASKGNRLMCRSAIVDLGLSDPDPGMVPNGAKCGEGKMCLNQKCVSVATLQESRSCPHNCYNNGWCNNLRHCHCKPGYTLPYCQHLYSGGSVDSGASGTAVSNVYNILL